MKNNSGLDATFHLAILLLTSHIKLKDQDLTFIKDNIMQNIYVIKCIA